MGIRKDNVLSLKWDRIDYSTGQIYLSGDKTKNKEEAYVPMNEAVQEALMSQIRRLDTPYVFYNKKGQRNKTLDRVFKTALRKAKIRDFTFHDLRHTFGSQLAMAGKDLRTIQGLMGHKNPSMTIRYTHFSPGHMAQAVNGLDEILSSFRSAQKLHNSKKMRVDLISNPLISLLYQLIKTQRSHDDTALKRV
jgi:integrase